MNELVQQLSERVHLDPSVAEKISNVLEQHAPQVAQLLGGDTEGLTQLLQKAGIDEGIVQKVVAFLKEHAADLSASLEREGGGGILKKAKDVLGSLMGAKEGA